MGAVAVIPKHRSKGIVTRRDISGLISRYKALETEKAIHEACTDKPSLRVLFLTRQMLLVDNWLSVLTSTEAMIIRKHLIEGMSWTKLSQICSAHNVSGDTRTLQRIQQRALDKIRIFTSTRFGDSLDHLLDN